ncbi:nicotinamide N-methyltransferase [Sarracenia purpurea var. burkii]
MAVKCKGPSMWKGIMKVASEPMVKQVFFENWRVRIGNGLTTRFLEDFWLGEKPEFQVVLLPISSFRPSSSWLFLLGYSPIQHCLFVVAGVVCFCDDYAGCVDGLRWSFCSPVVFL